MIKVTKKTTFLLKKTVVKNVFFSSSSHDTHKDGVPVFQITELCAIQNRSGKDHSPNSPNMFDLFGIIQNLNNFFTLRTLPNTCLEYFALVFSKPQGFVRSRVFGVFGSVQDFFKVIKSIMSWNAPNNACRLQYVFL